MTAIVVCVCVCVFLFGDSPVKNLTTTNLQHFTKAQITNLLQAYYKITIQVYYNRYTNIRFVVTISILVNVVEDHDTLNIEYQITTHALNSSP